MSHLYQSPESTPCRDRIRRLALPLMALAAAVAALVWGRPWTIGATAEELVMGAGLGVLLLGAGVSALARRSHPGAEMASAPLSSRRSEGRAHPSV